MALFANTMISAAIPLQWALVTVMRILYHHWLSPVARRVRLALHEKRLPVHEQIQEDWVRDEAFLALNPAGTVPVLVEEDGQVISDGNAICEYLEETNNSPSLMPGNAFQRAEVRRLIAWFDLKFNAEVTYPLVSEKMMKRIINSGAPDLRYSGRSRQCAYSP